jgi:hypothetical protein
MSSRLPSEVAARARNLADALGTPGTDERRLFARRLLERRGYRVGTPAERARLVEYLLTEVGRVAREQAGWARELADSRQLGDVSEEFAARSRLFRTRGLSLDTSLAPSFALEQSLRALKARGLLIIVVQRLDRRFDLMVATNIFVYYDVLDQVLALANVAAMLEPGGFLLSNNALLELPSSTIRSAGYLTVQNSDRSDDGDHVVWYQAK